MSARHALACLTTLALLVPATLLLGAEPGRADDTGATDTGATDTGATGETRPAAVSVLVTPQQRVRLEALPQIVQHGRQVASPDQARTAVTATVRPVRVGRRIQLQVQRGVAWHAVATVRQDRRGRAQFAAASSEGGEPLTYRVKAKATRGLRALRSDAVSTARWLDPTWTDEFSGSGLDPVWSHRGQGYERTSRRSCSKGDPSAVRVAGGAVRLSVLKDPDATTRCRVRSRDRSTVRGRFAHRLNGHIGTQGAFSFRYGVAAARVKFHRSRGQHGAFWLQPTDGMHPHGVGNEIDVVEYFGDRHPQGGLATFRHRYDGRRRVVSGGWIQNSRSFLQSRRDGWSKNYHVFSVEWTPRALVYRIDGKETVRMSRHVSDVRQFPILSLLASDYELPKIKERRLPQHMYVDWVRVWETGA